MVRWTEEWGENNETSQEGKNNKKEEWKREKKKIVNRVKKEAAEHQTKEDATVSVVVMKAWTLSLKAALTETYECGMWQKKC
jgi:hypothetical protein